MVFYLSIVRSKAEIAKNSGQMQVALKIHTHECVTYHMVPTWVNLLIANAHFWAEQVIDSSAKHMLPYLDTHLQVFYLKA